MMKSKYLIFLCMVFAMCQSSDEKDIRNGLNKKVNLSMADSVFYNGNKVGFDCLQKKYEFIYIVYLQNDCKPCYDTYVDWQNKIATISINNSTVLFIIKGDEYSKFIENAKEYGLKEDLYYTYMDRNDEFVVGNKNVPSKIVKQPLLVNSKNKIVLIGSPFGSPEMEDMYRTICSNKENGNRKD